MDLCHDDDSVFPIRRIPTQRSHIPTPLASALAEARGVVPGLGGVSSSSSSFLCSCPPIMDVLET